MGHQGQCVPTDRLQEDGAQSRSAGSDTSKEIGLVGSYGMAALVGLGLGWTWRAAVAPFGTKGSLIGITGLILACAFAIAARQGLESPAVRLKTAWSTCILGTIATAMLFLDLYAGQVHIVADLCAATCTSLSMLLWADTFARRPISLTNAGLAAAYVSGALTYATMEALPNQMGQGLALAAPLVETLLYTLAIANEPISIALVGNESRSIRTTYPNNLVPDLPWRAVAIVAACNFAAGVNRIHTGVSDDMVAMGLAGMLIAVVSWAFARKHSMYQVYRVFVPMMMAGLFTGVLLGQGNRLAQVGINVAYAFSGAVLMLYVCDAARRFGGSAIGMYAMCQLAVRPTFYMGSVAGSVAATHTSPWGMDYSAFLYAAMLTLMAVTLLFWLSDGRHTVQEKVPCDNATPGSAACEDTANLSAGGKNETDSFQGVHELMEKIVARRCAALISEYRLSKREGEVLELLAWGASSKRIEEQLCVSGSTAKTHIRHIYAKMGIHSRDELDKLVNLRAP